MLKVPHRAFVYLSSIDVYPDISGVVDENTQINAYTAKNLYALCKMASESIISKLATRPLILRAGLLLGPYMRQNNLTRMLFSDACTLTLNERSSFYCVGYSDILAIIEHSIEVKLSGTYNAVLCPQINLREIANHFGRKPLFGEFEYITPTISNKLLQKACPHFQGTSLSAIETYIDTLGPSGNLKNNCSNT
jgi:nucleoside-diphosphate-sugar epimerase